MLVQQAFTPCIQCAYTAGKSISKIALAMDAIKALFDQRATTFCLVTSDSDLAGLSPKLRERGATLHVIGEAKTPPTLRNASDQFFQWVPPARCKPQPRPKSLVSAVKLVAEEFHDGHASVSTLGCCSRSTDPWFSPQTYGHSGLVSRLKTYDPLGLRQEPGGHWGVTLPAPPAEVTVAPSSTA